MRGKNAFIRISSRELRHSTYYNDSKERDAGLVPSSYLFLGKRIHSSSCLSSCSNNFRFLNPEKDEDLMLLAQQYTKKKLLDDSLESKNMQISNLLELFSFIEDPWHAG